MLRHPDVLAGRRRGRAAGDGPARQVREGGIFGTQDNSNRYHITRLLATRLTCSEGEAADPLGTGIPGRTPDGPALMQKLGVAHEYRDGPVCKARLDAGGWPRQATLLLAEGMQWVVCCRRTTRGSPSERPGKAFVPWGFNYDHDESGG